MGRLQEDSKQVTKILAVLVMDGLHKLLFHHEIIGLHIRHKLWRVLWMKRMSVEDK